VKTLACLLLLAAPAVVGAADGDLDPAFGDAGITQVETELDDSASAVMVDPEGRVIVVFSAMTVPASSLIAVARFTPEGDLDASFDGDGIRAIGFSYGGTTFNVARDVALQADGKIVVAGYARDSTQSSFAGAVVRLLDDGTPDPAFDGDGIRVLAAAGQNHRFARIAIRPNGNLVVADGYDDTVEDAVTAIVELTPTGATFAFGSLDLFPDSDDSPAGLLLEPDGRMVVASVGFAEPELVVTRWHPGYTLDTSFGGDGVGHYAWTESVWTGDLDRLDDGRYLIGAGSDGWTGFRYLLPSGQADPSVCNPTSSCEYGELDRFGALEVQSDGRILAIGASDDNDVEVRRFLPGGTLDAGFGVAGLRAFDCEPGPASSTDTGIALALSNGRVVAIGNRGGPPADDGVCVARLTSSLIFADGFASGGVGDWSLPGF
jgi:uncharacterized delta-60 repeat protein